MPYVKGTATSLSDLQAKITEWVTDTTIHGNDAWTVMRDEAWPRGTIYKAKGINATNSAYIGIMLLNHVKGSSYPKWLLQTSNLMHHVIRSAHGLNLKEGVIVHTSGSSSFGVLNDSTDYSKGATTYTLSDVDIVNADCTALSFGVFKQYADELNWDEQPGAIEFDPLTFMPMYCSGTEIVPPVYPGVGYPGFGLPSGEPSTGSFTYWLIKDASHISVVINNNDQWDMAHAGMLGTFQNRMQYSFPAVMAGSNTGLRTICEDEKTLGDRIDYSYDSESLSRGMPAAPSINNTRAGMYISQIAICTPDGKWQYPYNWTQKLATVSLSGSSNNYVEGVPARKTNTGFCLRPTDTDLEKVTSMSTSVETISGTSIVTTKTETVTTTPFDIYEYTSDGDHNILGHLWNMYWPSLGHDFGPITINDELYLLLPNCWEGRLWYEPYLSTVGKYTLSYEVSGVLTIEERIARLKTIYEAVKAKYDEAQELYDDLVDYCKQFKILIKLEV
jgi:hypothetical protein